MFAVAKAGTAVASGLMGVVGANGNGLIVNLRTSNLCRVFTTDSEPVETQVLTAAATSADWHLIAVSYNPSSDELALFVDGVEAATATVALTFGSSRMSLFGGYDTTDLVDNEGVGLSIAMAGLINGAITDSAALQALIEDAVLSRMPTLF
jgi:hypothetical protein